MCRQTHAGKKGDHRDSGPYDGDSIHHGLHHQRCGRARQRLTAADPGERRPIYHDVAVLGGIRRSWPHRGVAPFAQFVVGARHSTNRDAGSSVDYLGLQPGAGIIFMVTPRFGIRTQLDLQIASPFDASYDGVSVFPRATVGAVFRFGVR